MWAQVPLAATNCADLAKIHLGSDGAEVGYGSAKQKYGAGGMDDRGMELAVWNTRLEGLSDPTDISRRGLCGQPDRLRLHLRDPKYHSGASPSTGSGSGPH